MNRIIRIYLYILPFYFLVSIILSALRTAYQDDYAQWVLLFGAVLDLIIIIAGRKFLRNKVIGFLMIFMTLSCVVGLLNYNELSRRYITDFTNPFFFFAKIYIFSAYWKQANFAYFIAYFKKVAFWGSLILLPFTYAIFASTKSTRLAIFPPMELPFAYYMQNGGGFFYASLIVILLYGKRSQFLSAIATMIIFVLLFRRRQFIKYALVSIVGIVALTFVFSNYSDNLAVSRLARTFERFDESADSRGAIEDVGGSRTAEVESILGDMTGVVDYVFGKGFGYTYKMEFNEIDKINANAHFSPIAFMSKYGIIFTIFLYCFILSVILKIKKSLFNPTYITAMGTCLFIFFESFFAYALFVAPIFPIAFGYILFAQSIKLEKIKL